MIKELPDTSASAISTELSLHQRRGTRSPGRVLTLVVPTCLGLEERVIEVASKTTWKYPCRIIVLVDSGVDTPARLDAQIRCGPEVGASEVIVLRTYGALVHEGASLITPLLLPDTPVVAWWPHRAPENASHTPIGRIAHRRIIDTANEVDPLVALKRVRRNYEPGDTDLAWTRLTNWRIQLATALDRAEPSPVRSISVEGSADSPSTILLAAWLAQVLGFRVEVDMAPAGAGLRCVRLDRHSGGIHLYRPGLSIARLVQSGHPVQQIFLPRRTLQDCLSEELRCLVPDEAFGKTLHGIDDLSLPHGDNDVVASGTATASRHGSSSLLVV